MSLQQPERRDNVCPHCGSRDEPVVITYEPQPNMAQDNAPDIETNGLKLIAAVTCRSCGGIHGTYPTEAERDTEHRAAYLQTATEYVAEVKRAVHYEEYEHAEELLDELSHRLNTAIDEQRGWE